ncbi:MAG: hypothetical protein ACE5HS_19635 [bacterium]
MKLTHSLQWLSLFILMGCNQPHSESEWLQRFHYQSGEVFPVEIGDFGYPYVSVKINSAAVNLVWDTGNMSELTLSRELADRWQLPVTGESKSYDSAGNVIGTFRTFRIDSLFVFHKKWQNVRAREFTNPKLNGLFGPRFVLGKRFTLDYRNKLLAVSSSPIPPPNSMENALLMVRSPEFAGLILVYGFVNRKKVLMEIDTGKSRTVVHPALAETLQLQSAANGFQIEEIRLGDFRFTVASAKVKSFQGISKGLPQPIQLGLGSDILSKFVLTVDYPQNIVLLNRLCN